MFLVLVLLEGWELVLDVLHLLRAARGAFSSLFQRVFLVIPVLICPVLPVDGHTASLEPVEGQDRMENSPKVDRVLPP